MSIRPTTLQRLYTPEVRLYGKNVKLINDEKCPENIAKNDCYDNAHIKMMRYTFARGSMLIRNSKHCSPKLKITVNPTLDLLHQVSIMFGWPGTVWNAKLTQHFYT